MSKTVLDGRALLLAPSRGFGGGIERVVESIEDAWNGPQARVDLSTPAQGWSGQPSKAAKFRFAGEAMMRAARFRPDVVLALHVGMLPVALLSARLTGAPVTLVIYGREAWASFGPLERALIRRCDHVLSISHFTADWFAQRSGFDRARIAVVPLPLHGSLASGNGSEDKTPLHGRPKRLLTVCRLSPDVRYKGYLDVARSLPAIVREFPEAEWVVAGDGPDRTVLAEECRRNGVADRVRLLGRVTDQELAALYSEAYAFVMPSVARPCAQEPWGEGFGLVYLEAAAAGVPSIVSTEGGGCLEFVQPGATGLAVPPQDPAELARAVTALLADPELRDHLGHAARRRACIRHSPARFREGIEAALEYR